jgi:hypothetical protein
VYSDPIKILGKYIILLWKLAGITLMIYSIGFDYKSCLKNEYWWVEPQTKLEFYIGIICISLTSFLMFLAILASLS